MKLEIGGPPNLTQTIPKIEFRSFEIAFRNEVSHHTAIAQPQSLVERLGFLSTCGAR